MASKATRAPQFALAFLLAGLFTASTLQSWSPSTQATASRAGPRIVSPASRVIGFQDMQIVSEAGPDDHVYTEFELWRVSGYQLEHKVWQARVDSGDLTSATLEAGKFESGFGALEPWKRYAIRARHGTSKGPSEWGPKLWIRTDDGSEAFFDQSVIREFRLEIPAASWSPIDAEALTDCEPHERSYYPGMIRIDEIDFPGSGLRVKGGCGSSRTLEQKAAFKANMSWDDPAVEGCPETRRYMGLKKVTLNNQVQDASYTHERIGYDFLTKLGVPVPRVAPARVYVNDQLWGLYLHVETVDRRFLARRFDSKDGMLYEAEYGCDIGEESCFEEKFDTDACDEPRAGDVTNIFPLRSLHGRLSQLPSDDIYPAIHQIFDFNTYLSMWAAAAIMGYFDGYPYEPNNYRVYHDPSNDLWSLIPTGIDQLFERDVDPFNPVGMLGIRCLAEADCRAAFRRKLAEALDIFEASDYAAMARDIERQVRAEVEADPRREISLSEWQAAVDQTVRYIQRRPGELRDLLARTVEEHIGRNFHFHALTDPNGDRFVFVTWAVPGDEASPGLRWIVAKGLFKALEAKMDALELAGGSSDGVKVGTVTVSYANCDTAQFVYQPDRSGAETQVRRAPIESSIWKYCE